MSAIFFDTDDDAAELVKALEAEGYATILRAELFAGEDDAEDTSWVLHVEPFDERVVEMVDVYGGWLDHDARLDESPAPLPDHPAAEGPAPLADHPAAQGPAPLPLPDAPRRVKNPRDPGTA